MTNRRPDPPQARPALGHGFRVEARIVTWSQDDALIVPSGALFRAGPDRSQNRAQNWALFTVEGGIARQRIVTVAANNGTTAAIASGLEEGETLILYPPPGLADGQKVAQRQVN